MLLSRRTKYLQVALNSTLDDAFAVINSLPLSDRILIEAGTPLIKKYGISSITRLKSWWEARLSGATLSSLFVNTSENAEVPVPPGNLGPLVSLLMKQFSTPRSSAEGETFNAESHGTTEKPKVAFGATKGRSHLPVGNAYIVADLKTMDRAVTETTEVKMAGASAAVVLGLAPLETLNAFIDSCEKLEMDSMVDMMNVEQPYKILRTLKKLPTVVILHRGVDEEAYNKNKPLPYHNIIKVKGSYNILISVAGGDTSREVQRAIFNGADIVVVWKDFYKIGSDTGSLAAEFLKEIK